MLKNPIIIKMMERQMVERQMSDKASVQLIENPARKSLSKTHKKRKGKDQVNDDLQNK